MKFTKEIKEKWIKALKSGVYPKGTGRLQDGGKYCCLGVLAVVAGKAINDQGVAIEEGNTYGGGLGLDGITCEHLFELNDDTYGDDEDFKRMIPHIKKLETDENI